MWFWCKTNYLCAYYLSHWSHLSCRGREKAKLFANQSSEWKIYLLLFNFKGKKEKVNQWGNQFSHCMAVWTHLTNFWPLLLLSIENKRWGKNWVQRKIQIILFGIKILSLIHNHFSCAPGGLCVSCVSAECL